MKRLVGAIETKRVFKRWLFKTLAHYSKMHCCGALATAAFAF